MKAELSAERMRIETAKIHAETAKLVQDSKSEKAKLEESKKKTKK